MLGWPGYRVWQQEIDEKAKTLKLWVRRKRGNKRVCSGCGRQVDGIHEICEREVRDFRASVPDDGGDRTVPGAVPGLRAEDREGAAVAEQSAVQQTLRGCGGTGVRERLGAQVARQFGLAASTVRAIDLRYLERWAARGESRRCGRWAWMRSIWGRSRNSSRW